jgi:hypothetical protein
MLYIGESVGHHYVEMLWAKMQCWNCLDWVKQPIGRVDNFRRHVSIANQRKELCRS